MKRNVGRTVAVLMALTLCLSFLPAQAAEGSAFTDVPAGSWYEEGVATCAEKGVMVGTGEGVFSPDTALTAAECLTLAVRLYDLQHGGDGTLEKAPEEWGQITLTIEGQEPITGGSDRFVRAAYNFSTSTASYPNVRLALPVAEEDKDWASAQSGKAAVLTAGGASLAGTVKHSYIPANGTALFFFPEAGGGIEAENIAMEYCQIVCPGPDQWWRDAVYTAQQLGVTIFSGFAPLLERDLSGGGAACRDEFARALADAAGELPKLYTVETIYDSFNADAIPLVRLENESIYTLYEAGILNGINEFGDFGGREHLTRAQAAVMVARVLDPSQRLTKDPDIPLAYDLAVTKLRGSLGYHNEQTLEAEDCTIFIYDLGGFMNAPCGTMTVIYKPGSILGDGAVVDLPHARVEQMNICRPADTMTLGEDGKTFTYTYYREEDIVYQGEVLEQAGVITYTVDLPTGTVTETFSPHSYATSLAHVTRKRIISGSEHSEGREVVQTLDTDLCTAVLTRGTFVDQYDDYILSLVYKSGSALGDGTIKQLLLPSTVYDAGYPWYVPTDRAPDSLELSEDGQRLTYVYRFDEPLTDGETVYHETGTYVYTVDLASGELAVRVEDPYQWALSNAIVTDGTWRVDEQLETPLCTILVQHSEGWNGVHPYASITLIFKDGSPNGAGSTVDLPVKRGNAPYGSIPPHSVFLNEDKTVLTYIYQFDKDQSAVTLGGHSYPTYKAGTYTTTVDLSRGTIHEEYTPN